MADFFFILRTRKCCGRIFRYEYVEKYPNIYKKLNKRDTPIERRSNNTMLELANRFKLMNLAFDQEDYRVDKNLEVI